MAGPSAYIGSGDRGHSLGDGAVEDLTCRRLGATKGIFELRPRALDGIEFGRIGRQEHHVCTDATNGSDCGHVLVSGEIVHDYDIARAQPWDELLLDEGAEYIAVGGGVDRDESTPAVQRDSAD